MEIMNSPEKSRLDFKDDLICEYIRCKDIKRTARVFLVSTSDVRKILISSGIEIEKKNRTFVLEVLDANKV